jgi:hypothetical protein
MTDTKAIPCSEAVRQLWDYVDHAIPPEDQEKVEKHLSFCFAEVAAGNSSSPRRCGRSSPLRPRRRSHRT